MNFSSDTKLLNFFYLFSLFIESVTGSCSVLALGLLLNEKVSSVYTFSGVPRNLPRAKAAERGQTAEGEAKFDFFADFFYKFNEVLHQRGSCAMAPPSPCVR